MAKIQRTRARVGRVILFRRERSPFWYIKYPVGIRIIRNGKHDGKTKIRYHVESTGLTSLRKAQLIAQEIDLKLFKGKMGMSTGRTTLSGLREAFLDYQEKDTDNRYWHRRHLMSRTQVFVDWARGKGIQLASAVRLDIAELFVRHLRYEVALQDRTVKNYVADVGGMYSWGQRRQPPLVDNNPFATGRKGNLRIVAGPANTRSDDDRYETYTQEQIQKLIETALVAGDTQIAQIIIMLAETGFRSGELQFLTPADLDWSKGFILVRNKLVTGPLHRELKRLLDRNGRWWPKDETDRRVIMSPTCYKVLEEMSSPGTNRARVFQNQDGLPVQDQGTRERLQRYATEAGVMLIMPGRGKHSGRAWSQANWKMFRNYFVSRAASGGISFIHVMEATGHDSYGMVRHYFRLNDDAYRKDFKKFDGGLTGIDLDWRAVTRQNNTPGTHPEKESLFDKDLRTERGGFEPPVRV